MPRPATIALPTAPIGGQARLAGRRRPRTGAENWGRELGPRTGAENWGRELGPRTGAENWRKPYQWNKLASVNGRRLRDQCAEDDGIAFFFKQWGDWSPATGWRQVHDISLAPDGKRTFGKCGRQVRPASAARRCDALARWPPAGGNDGRTHDEMPKVYDAQLERTP